MPKIKRLLAANRSEIAIRIFRSTHELGIRTVAIYSHEDRYALHRFKADEAYEVGKAGEPIQAYLNIDGIITLAKKYEIDAIHPGYGFLSENPNFAQACEDAGIIFVGPRVETLKQLGDKISARKIAEKAGVPVLGGGGSAIRDAEHGKKLTAKVGFPVILKAAHGGGGRGMRVVREAAEFESAFEQARRESRLSPGSAAHAVAGSGNPRACHPGSGNGTAFRNHPRAPRPGGLRRLRPPAGPPTRLPGVTGGFQYAGIPLFQRALRPHGGCGGP